jgi:cytochrome c oxidase assembly factor CtaG
MAIFLILLCVGYFYLNDFHITRKSRYFFAGYILIILSVASPLHFLAENYLMSAHMLSHIIVLLIAAPLIVLGIPENNSAKWITKVSELLGSNPWLSWISGVCIMWLWHVPVIFNSLFEGPFAMILQNVHLISLVMAGVLFCWPVIGPDVSQRIPALNAVLYLSAACVFCSILGLMITFAPSGIYTHYINPDDHPGLLALIRNQNGISAQVDQQIAGLIMWVPGCLLYLTASMYLLMKWLHEKNQQVSVTNQKAGNDRK